MLGSFTLGKISTYLDKYDKIEQLYGFAKVFEEITKHLLYFNESINTAVNKCLLSVSKQEELNMRNGISIILSHRTQIHIRGFPEGARIDQIRWS